jgi:hypothetical protein
MRIHRVQGAPNSDRRCDSWQRFGQECLLDPLMLASRLWASLIGPPLQAEEKPRSIEEMGLVTRLGQTRSVEHPGTGSGARS